MRGGLLGDAEARRARMRLLAAASVPFTIGVASKYYHGPGSVHVIGQALDYFGTVFLILAARVVFLRPPVWKVACPVLGALTILEFSQRLHGELLERARGSWIGLHVLGSCFEWLDLLAYLLAALTVLRVEPWIVGRTRQASTAAEPR
ncbi:MAG: DUF2809 domain-containing protein [Byssovorax sp.]